jgi:hypothetical protein
VTDVLLLLIMLFGLLRMRLDAGGAFGLGRIPWNQVRWWQFSLFPNLLKYVSIRMGLVWLFLATVTEVPTTVRMPIILHPFFFS